MEGRKVTGSAGVDALDAGRGFAPLAGWRVLAIRGDDARAWLHDLVTADVASLPDGHARRSLILSPTGRIRADVHVGAAGDTFLLLQDPVQPEPAAQVLAPYVLSSDVSLEDRTDLVEVVAVLGGSAAEDGADTIGLQPSVLGSGRTVVVPAGEPARAVRRRFADAGLVEIDPAALETWRIRRGIARTGVDLGPDSLPAEAGLEVAIDFTKGCFLGQESVAKVANLGHPPRLVVAVHSADPTAPGTRVLADGEPVGTITSAAAEGDGTAAMARVRWDAARRPLDLEGAGPLALRSEE